MPISLQINLYNNYTGIANKDLSIDSTSIILIDSDNNQYTLNKEITYVIDFWDNNCVTCIEVFPLVESLQEKYKNEEGVKILTLNVVKNESDINVANEIILNNGYENLDLRFMDSSFKNVFDIKWVPKTVVLRNNKILFEGNMEVLRILDYFGISPFN